MGRVLSLVAFAVVVVWVIAHILVLGPVQDAAEVTITWTLAILAASAVVAAVTVLALGLVLGGSRPAWLRFVEQARTGAAVVGCALVVVGLLHYRDTEPRGEVHWIVLGLVVLVGAAVVHWWVVRVQRRVLS
jgi:hypothetical protein